MAKKIWFGMYLDAIDMDKLDEVREPLASSKTFCFGNNGRLYSKGRYIVHMGDMYSRLTRSKNRLTVGKGFD